MKSTALFYGVDLINNFYRIIGGAYFAETFDKETGKYSVKLKVFSISTVYTIFFQCVQYYLVWMMAVRSIKALVQMEDVEKMTAISYMFTVFSPMLLPFFGAAQLSKVQTLYDIWYTMENDLVKVATNPEPLDLGVRHLSKVALALALISSLSFSFVVPALQRKSVCIVDILETLGYCHIAIVYIYYYATCKASSAASTRILKEYLELVDSSYNSENIDGLALSFRKVWLQMNIIMKYAGNTFSLPLAFAFLISFEMVIFLGYSLLVSLGKMQLAGFLFISSGLVLSWFGIVAVCTAGHQLHGQVKKDLVETICATKRLRARKNTIETINTFLLHLIQISPPLNLDGYMKLDRSTLTTLVSVYITNLVVLVQLGIGSALTTINDVMRIRQQLFT